MCILLIAVYMTGATLIHVSLAMYFLKGRIALDVGLPDKIQNIRLNLN